jgi:hypothetical protein
MNAIQVLSLNASMHDLILNHLLLSVLDSETHKEWELHTSRQQDLPSTTEVTEFLENSCKTLELLQANQSSGTTAASPQYAQSDGAKVSEPSCNLVTQMQCPSCKEPHRLFKCNRFLKLQPKQCLNCVRQLGVCFDGLQPYSKNHTCSNQTCRTCSKLHHTLLHLDRQTQAPRDKSSTTSNNKSSNAQGNSTAEVNTYCSFKGKPMNHILLAIVIVEVKNKFGQYVPC